MELTLDVVFNELEHTFGRCVHFSLRHVAGLRLTSDPHVEDFGCVFGQLARLFPFVGSIESQTPAEARRAHPFCEFVSNVRVEVVVVSWCKVFDLVNNDKTLHYMFVRDGVRYPRLCQLYLVRVNHFP